MTRFYNFGGIKSKQLKIKGMIILKQYEKGKVKNNV